MRRKWFALCGTTLFSITLLTVLAMAMAVGMAQQPQGPWLTLEASVSPGEVSLGDGFLTILTLRNEGTEPATVDEVTVELPGGFVYVGQGVGSDVADSPLAEQSQLRWTGPFTVPAGAELHIRFAAVAGNQATPGQYPFEVVALSGEQTLAVEPLLTLLSQDTLEPSVTQPAQVNGAAVAPSAVQVSKTADPASVKPGNPVAYTVTFSNGGAAPVTLDTIADLLPAPFQYVRLAYGSQITVEPSDQAEPEIVWAEWEGDPPVVPAGETLVLRYWVWVPPDTPFSPAPFTNEVTASSGGSPVGTASANVEVQVPSFSLTKAASPTKVTVGEIVNYTVTFHNGGSGEGTLDTINDTLPAGFEFVEMGPGSDWGDPSSTGETLVWTDNLTVPAGESRQLVYRVYAGGLGAKENQVEAVTTDGTPLGPASEVVEVEGIRTFLPMVTRRVVPPTTLPFEDTFNQGVSSDWVVFLNYPGLSTKSWYWQGDVPTWGRYIYDLDKSPAPNAYALSMYLGPGSQAWTDYEVTTTMKNAREKIAGLWIRGTLVEKNDLQGGQVGGYYVWMKPGAEGHVLLARINPGALHYHEYTILKDVVYAPGIGTVGWFNLKVQVQGTNIKVWLKKSTDSAYGSALINVNDATYTSGTVGFSAWKTYVLYDDIRVTPLTTSDQ